MLTMKNITFKHAVMCCAKGNISKVAERRICVINFHGSRISTFMARHYMEDFLESTLFSTK